jgi:hypothetical protein
MRLKYRQATRGLAALCLILVTATFSVQVGSAQAPSSLFKVRVNGKFGFVDAAGNVVIAPQFVAADDFSEGLAAFAAGEGGIGAWGYLDEAGRVAIPAQFAAAWPFSEGVAAVRIKQPGSVGLVGYIDRQGQVVIAPQFSTAGAFYQGRAWASFVDNPAASLIDTQGNPVGDAIFVDGWPFADGLAAASVWLPDLADVRYGYVDVDGQWAIPPQFASAESFSDGLAAVRAVDGGFGYIDRSGAWKILPRFEGAQRFSNGRAAVRSGDRYGYIDTAGTLVIPATFLNAESFSEGLAAVTVDDTAGYIDTTGKLVIRPQFDRAGSFRGGLAPVLIDMTATLDGGLQGGKLGYINTQGAFVWAPKE